MDDKITVLLEKINIDKENYQYFSSAKLNKIKVYSKNNSWDIFISNPVPFPLDIIKELELKKHELDESATNINFIFDIQNINLETYVSYYPYVLEQVKENLKVLEIYEDCLKMEDGFLVLVVTTEIEQERLESCLDKISTIYKKLGYPFNIEIKLCREESILA